MSQPFSNNVGSFNTNISLTVPDELPNILAWLSPLDPKLRHQDIRDRREGDVGGWLSPLDPKLRHQDIRDRREGDVGGWLLQTEEFRSWYTGSEEGESDNAVLFCYGGPGAGKTFIR